MVAVYHAEDQPETPLEHTEIQIFLNLLVTLLFKQDLVVVFFAKI